VILFKDITTLSISKIKVEKTILFVYIINLFC